MVVCSVKIRTRWSHPGVHIGNESVPKIIINDTINLLFKAAINILAISNHSSSRALFDKIVSVCCIWKIYL